MDQTNSPKVLQLKIRNTEALQSGNTRDHVFERLGGTLGSNQNAEWQIQDLYKSVSAVHAQIEYNDSEYFIKPLGDKLFINRSEISLNSKSVKLQHGDEIRVGNLVILVRIADSLEFLLDDPLDKSPEQIISMREISVNDMLKTDNPNEASYHFDDDLSASQANEVIDPLKAIEKDSQDELTRFYNSIPNNQQQVLTRTSSLTDYNANAEQGNVLDNSFIDVPRFESKLYDDNTFSMEKINLSLVPFLRGLGIGLDISNTDEANLLLEELGETLKATVEGLLKLNHSKAVLKNKNLRPIEDNPLRLNQNYADTMDLLFSEQPCTVYLSAPAAVKESLENVAIHNQASEVATKFALSAMLDAFSPEQLTNRFEIYRNSRRVKEHDGTWFWNMYCSYYKELSSNRQQGFEKLFWEHYEQEYDRQLRLLNQEQQRNV
ncbi:type VI secretion system-associated FHA domain protein TagH [Gilliamella apicola]|uniref:Type VI secretion system-associated FHA domain protein TagH n=1 Tax=Gilliamella apicola TaxID=1196095 RepID=A0A2V4E1W2_9GAMM|nr:type VI secretion system-associated FHA domain protein TagH [Gilliamella apicola]PXZ07182.1 type VI secretion system-associated FHA domain protein TagH [Gilliamella apicola]